MADLIDRQKAIETAVTMCERCTTGDIIDLRDMICESLAVLPTADTDMSEYSDRLWKLAYERGKAEGVVRCRDCVWRLGTDCTRFAETPVTLDDFCSRGERKRSR